MVGQNFYFDMGGHDKSILYFQSVDVYLFSESSGNNDRIWQLAFDHTGNNYGYM